MKLVLNLSRSLIDPKSPRGDDEGGWADERLKFLTSVLGVFVALDGKGVAFEEMRLIGFSFAREASKRRTEDGVFAMIRRPLGLHNRCFSDRLEPRAINLDGMDVEWLAATAIFEGSQRYYLPV